MMRSKSTPSRSSSRASAAVGAVTTLITLDLEQDAHRIEHARFVLHQQQVECAAGAQVAALLSGRMPRATDLRLRDRQLHRKFGARAGNGFHFDLHVAANGQCAARWKGRVRSLRASCWARRRPGKTLRRCAATGRRRCRHHCRELRCAVWPAVFAAKLTEPARVYLMALEIRLRSTWPMSAGSEYTSSPGESVENRSPLLLAMPANSRRNSSNSGPSSNRVSSSLMAPDSSLLISRSALIRRDIASRASSCCSTLREIRRR